MLCGDLLVGRAECICEEMLHGVTSNKLNEIQAASVAEHGRYVGEMSGRGEPVAGKHMQLNTLSQWPKAHCGAVLGSQRTA